VPAAAIGHL